MTFRLGTFNVHQWVDANYVDNFERVVDLIGSQNLDIVCLQEVTALNDAARYYKGSKKNGGVKTIFAYVLGLKHCISWQGCAIFSRFKFTRVIYDGETRRTAYVKTALGHQTERFVMGSVQPDPGCTPIHLTCLHLNHVAEPIRLTQLRFIGKAVGKLVLQSDDQSQDFSRIEHPAQIWTGDFNALTREDYSEGQWQEVALVREQGCWERPKVELTEKIKSVHGMVDCWELIGKPDPIKTCRFDTRIDYVYGSPSLLEEWSLQSVDTVDDPASDHNLVIATFTKKISS